MKFFVALISLGLVVACVSADWEAAKKRLKEAHTKCNEDSATAISEDVVEKLHKGEKPERTDNLGAHMLCVSKHLGWQNADGTVNKELVKERITSNVSDASKHQEILDKCNVDKETAIATAINLFRCIGAARKDNVVH